MENVSFLIRELIPIAEDYNKGYRQATFLLFPNKEFQTMGISKSETESKVNYTKGFKLSLIQS